MIFSKTFIMVYVREWAGNFLQEVYLLLHKERQMKCSTLAYMAPKNNGIWRPCGDYRCFNLVMEPDHYTMPNISDLTSSISTSRVFSKLDQLKGYFQVPVNSDDVPKQQLLPTLEHVSSYVLNLVYATVEQPFNE